METKSTNQYQTPSSLIQWLMISFKLIRIIVWLLFIGFVGWPLSQIYLAGQADLSYMASPFTGLVILSMLISMYWRHVGQGIKPKKDTQVDGNILRYFSWHGRNLWWKAILSANSAGERFGLRHLFKVLAEHRGVQLSMLRLGISPSELEKIISETETNWDEFLSSALSFAIPENSRISWEDMWRAIFDYSKPVQQYISDQKISIDEAVATINWSRRDLYYRGPRQRFFADLFSTNRNLNRTWTARPTPTLERFSQNLTDLARLGVMTSAKVRETEVDQAIQILSKSQENNLILVGEPGVGKTSVVGDIALRLIRGDVPALHDFKLISLDVNSMIGAGENFQTLFSRAIDEASLSGNTILYIGNLDQFGKVKSADGFDLSSILMSALENKGLQLIGTSDVTNYKKYIENNSNFAKFFTRLNIEEMSPVKSVLVLQESSREIENRQGVIVTLSAIKKAVELTVKLLHNGKLPESAEQILDESAVYVSRQGQTIVGPDAIEAVLSTKTNIPVGEIGVEEKTKLATLDTEMAGRVIGQDEAVTAVVQAIRRARLGVSGNSQKPIGSFLFLGPTGVGKTETAKALAQAYFGDETKMIRLDMSEFQTPESVYRLVGAPAGSDLSLSGGQFTEAVKATPFAVILLDEIEKSHPDVLNIFLQVLDEGRLTDNLGNTINFSHTIIIATSNAQATFIQDEIKKLTSYESLRSQVIERLVRDDFRPEFINRFDGVVVFKPLTIENITAIARLKVAKLIKHLQDNKDINLTVTDEAIAKLAELGYDPAFGARPLERVIREQVENFVAHSLLSDNQNNQIEFSVSDIG